MRSSSVSKGMAIGLVVLGACFVLISTKGNEADLADEAALHHSSPEAQSIVTAMDESPSRAHELSSRGGRTLATKATLEQVDQSAVPASLSFALLEGQLVDQERRPIVGGELRLESFTSPLVRRLRAMADTELWEGPRATEAELSIATQSGAGGRFRFEQLTPGDYRLTVRAAGFDSVVLEPLTIREARTAPLVVRLGVGVSLTGFVSDDQDHPIEGAALYIGSAGEAPTVSALTAMQSVVETDAQGAFTLQGLASGGEVTLVVTADGHVSRSIRVDPDSGPAHVRLETAGHLEGAVTSRNGEWVSGARVRLQSTENNSVEVIYSADCRTDEQGEFRFGGLPIGAYLLSIDSWAGRREALPVSVTADTAPVAVALTAQEALAVRVVREDGTVVVGAEVHSEPAERGERAPAANSNDFSHLTRFTGTDGSVRFHGLETGLWRVSASAFGNAPTEALVTVAAATRELELVLQSSGSIVLDVVDASGAPVAQASVVLRRPDDITYSVRKVSDGTGRIVWEGLPEGPFTLVHDPAWIGRALGEGASSLMEPSFERADVVAGVETSVRLELSREAILRVTVNRSGVPVERAEVMLVERSHWTELAWRSETQTGLSRTGSAGTVVLPPVLPGLYALCVRASQGGMLNVFDVVVDSGHQATEVELPGAPVRGFVFDDDLQPIQGAEINLAPVEFAGFGKGCLSVEDESGANPYRWSPGQSATSTSADGSFEFLDVDAGAYELEVRAPGYAPWYSKELEFNGSSVELDPIELSSACTLRGRVLGRGQRADATPGFVSLVTEQGEHVSATLLDADDRFELVEIPRGRYRLVASLDGREVRGESFDVVCEFINVQDLEVQ